MSQVRAEFGTLDQLAVDQGTHAGTIEGYRDALAGRLRTGSSSSRTWRLSAVV